MKFSGGNEETLSETPVRVDAEHFEALAAVAPPLPAGPARLTVEVRLDRAPPARPHVRYPRAHGGHLGG